MPWDICETSRERYLQVQSSKQKSNTWRKNVIIRRSLQQSEAALLWVDIAQAVEECAETVHGARSARHVSVITFTLPLFGLCVDGLEKHLLETVDLRQSCAAAAMSVDLGCRRNVAGHW